MGGPAPTKCRRRQAGGGRRGAAASTGCQRPPRLAEKLAATPHARRTGGGGRWMRSAGFPTGCVLSPGAGFPSGLDSGEVRVLAATLFHRGADKATVRMIG